MSDSASTVSEVVWPWRTPRSGFHRPSPAHVLLMSCIPYAVALLVYFLTDWEHRGVIATIATTVGTVQLILGLILPKAYVKVEWALFQVVHLVGFLLTWLLLVPLYLTFFLIAHLGLKLRGKDLMHRKPDPDAETYWITREPVNDPAVHYRRQF